MPEFWAVADRLTWVFTPKQIEKLEDVSESLEELWLSYNLITSLDGLGTLTKLTTLYMSNNQIKAWAELDKLASGCGRLRPLRASVCSVSHVRRSPLTVHAGRPAQPPRRTVRGEPHLRGPVEGGGQDRGAAPPPERQENRWGSHERGTRL